MRLDTIEELKKAPQDTEVLWCLRCGQVRRGPDRKLQEGDYHCMEE